MENTNKHTRLSVHRELCACFMLHLIFYPIAFCHNFCSICNLLTAVLQSNLFWIFFMNWKWLFFICGGLLKSYAINAVMKRFFSHNFKQKGFRKPVLVSINFLCHSVFFRHNVKCRFKPFCPFVINNWKVCMEISHLFAFFRHFTYISL